MELSKDDVILAQAELIARQNRRIDTLTKRVDDLIDSVNWYENATRHQETFEQLRSELEGIQRKFKVVYNDVPCGCGCYTFECNECADKLVFEKPLKEHSGVGQRSSS